MTSPVNCLRTVVTVRLSGLHLEDVRIARDSVGAILRNEPADLATTATLLTSELATNALIHGDTANLRPGQPPTLVAPRPFSVAVEVWISEIRVRVRGMGSRTAVIRPRRERDWDETGRGLALVEDLSHDWGTDGDHSYRQVWFTLLRRPAAAVPAA
ncbi:ATP-binding protein [Marinactinospora rubrisoli]|uniref:ATP-binding protein n=1 Tax=Marinactinospora rubrisoli TaxID=2715399 RepID=A0ABW2KBD4_9ACTN